MRFHPFFRPNRSKCDNKRSSIYDKAEEILARQADAILKLLDEHVDDHRNARRLYQSRARLVKAKRVLGKIRVDKTSNAAGMSVRLLRSLYEKLLANLQTTNIDLPRERGVITNALQAIVEAENAIGAHVGQPVHAGGRIVVVPADLLYGAYDALFPAERMLVASGYRIGPRTRISTLFDVTGSASMSHVDADSSKLASSLITMEATGTHLAAWFHSHPGSGPTATIPSQIDWQQYAEWSRHYVSTLLCGIFVRDGFVRFWGRTTESEAVRIQVLGNGVEKKENDSGQLYRLSDRSEPR